MSRRQRDVFRVVRARPSEPDCDPVGLVLERARRLERDRSLEDALERGLRLGIVEVASPRELPQRRSRLGAQERRRDRLVRRKSLGGVAQDQVDGGARVDDEHGSVLGALAADDPSDARKRSAGHRGAPGGWNRQLVGCEHVLEIRLLDDVLRSDLACPQLSGADPAPDRLGISRGQPGRFRDGQHWCSIQHVVWAKRRGRNEARPRPLRELDAHAAARPAHAREHGRRGGGGGLRRRHGERARGARPGRRRRGTAREPARLRPAREPGPRDAVAELARTAVGDRLRHDAAAPGRERRHRAAPPSAPARQGPRHARPALGGPPRRPADRELAQARVRGARRPVREARRAARRAPRGLGRALA